jgi:hypothetical protein
VANGVADRFADGQTDLIAGQGRKARLRREPIHEAARFEQ